MKQTMKGIRYDTEASRKLTEHPEPGVETTLYMAPTGHFFLHLASRLVDGKPIPRSKFVEQIVPDFFEVMARTKRHPRVGLRERIRPLSRAEAFRWCIRTQMPRTFHKELARFLK